MNSLHGRQVSRRDDRFKQRRLHDFLTAAAPPAAKGAGVHADGAAAMADDMEVGTDKAFKGWPTQSRVGLQFRT